MKPNRLVQGLLMTAALLLVLPAAQAKRPDDGGNDARNGRGRYEAPAGRDDRRAPRYEERRDDRQRAPRYEERRAPGGSADRYEPRYQDQRPDPDRQRAVEPRREAPSRGLSDAVREAERRTGGQVLSAEPRDEGGRPVYRVKVLTPDGRVRVLYLDAR